MLAETFDKFGLNPDKRNKLGYTSLLLACKCGHYVSGHVLVTMCRASPTLRDGEFHLNAAEGIQRTHQIQVFIVSFAGRLFSQEKLASALKRALSGYH